MSTGIILMLVLILLIGAGFWLWKLLNCSATAPAVEQLRHNDEYKNASPQEKLKMEREMMAHFATCQDICGEIIAPGEQILALGDRLDYFDMCDAEDLWRDNLDDLPEFVGPAQAYLDKLRTMMAEDSDQAAEIQSQIEMGEDCLTKAAWILANPEAALAKWKQDREWI